jgi:hypothetical protein
LAPRAGLEPATKRLTGSCSEKSYAPPVTLRPTEPSGRNHLIGDGRCGLPLTPDHSDTRAMSRKPVPADRRHRPDARAGPDVVEQVTNDYRRGHLRSVRGPPLTAYISVDRFERMMRAPVAAERIGDCGDRYFPIRATAPTPGPGSTASPSRPTVEVIAVISIRQPIMPLIGGERGPQTGGRKRAARGAAVAVRLVRVVLGFQASDCRMGASDLVPSTMRREHTRNLVLEKCCTDVARNPRHRAGR